MEEKNTLCGDTSIEKVNEYKEVVKQLIETDNRSEEEMKVLLEMHKSQFGD
jgi:predicted house-cleaning noncanonical NTP pyrophosphatase (MazG superfamily)